jgi:hypothetical protein
VHHKTSVDKVAICNSSIDTQESIWIYKRQDNTRLPGLGFLVPSSLSQIKKEVVILKLDFEKAFDKLEHQVILQLLKNKGFSEKWIGWIQNILRTPSSLVILNGVPKKSFNCKSGII